jgi:hypothetical protein
MGTGTDTDMDTEAGPLTPSGESCSDWPENFSFTPQIFYFAVYRVHSAVDGRNFTPIGEYLNTAKNLRKRYTFFRCFGTIS